ncbi:MAG: molybdopterin containing oxidoreductase [Hyphomicrobium sp. 32-62-53]|nr:MAG: molybdopterin containing oxidoreductase [Hyphomicrobium sp. 32-62-53]
MAKQSKPFMDEDGTEGFERSDISERGSAGTSRRGFLESIGLAAVGTAVGVSVPFAGDLPLAVSTSRAYAQDAKTEKPAPEAVAEGPQKLNMPGKDGGLVVLGERPLVAETPEHLLDDDTTPTSKLFIRNNGTPPELPADLDGWKLVIDGEVNSPLEISLGELKKKAKPVTLRMMLECGGNGRSFFSPPAKGNQWTNGGAGCPEWTGIPLRELLKEVGVKDSAIYTAHYGADTHLSGDASKVTLSRGVPIAKAMDEHTLLAWGMNGEPMPAIHGGPLRLIAPGWAGSASHKWLTKITIRDKEHDGPGMTGTSYRTPIKPMIPGSKADPANFKVLESMPVRSIISNPMNGAKLAAGTREIPLRGAAWAGELAVSKVDVSADYGVNWSPMTLAKPTNKYDWTRWTGSVKLPSDGYYELWVRATDSNGAMQPHAAPNWNPAGYGGNPFHRIAVLVG